MKTRMLSLSLVLVLAAGIGASPAAAASCKKRCKQAVKICTGRACAGFKGRVKGACKSGLRRTIVASCKVAPTEPVCEDIAAANCQ
jgi:hypothetical protein